MSLLALTVVVGGFGGWALFGSDWLRVERVSVSWAGGPRELTAQQVLEAADVPLGVPMASLDKGGVRERLRAELPRLRSVEIVRAWPHGVNLKVTERQAEVLIPAEDGYTEVDAEGVAFSVIPEAPDGIPLLELELAEEASLRRFGADRVREGAVQVAAALPDAITPQTEAIHVRSYDAITLQLSGNRTVLWGSPEDPQAKAEALLLLMKAEGSATHFDVSVPSAPAAAEG